jgi:hypothetical protein
MVVVDIPSVNSGCGSVSVFYKVKIQYSSAQTLLITSLVIDKESNKNSSIDTTSKQQSTTRLLWRWMDQHVCPSVRHVR